MLGMETIRAVLTALVSDLQEMELRVEVAVGNSTTDGAEEGPLLFPTLMKASPVVALALFAASVKWSQWIYSEGIVDVDGDISTQASYYQQYLDFLRREAAFHLSLCLWVAVTEFYREEEEEVPQFLLFFLMTLVFEWLLNFSAILYDLYAERNSPLRSSFLNKLKHMVLRSTVPSVIAAPLIKEVSFDILYRRESTHPWLWVTLAGASTQIPRQIVSVFLPRLGNALWTYCHSDISAAIEDEVSHSETDEEEQYPLLSVSTQIKDIDSSLMIALPWSLLAIMTTTLSWDMASVLGSWMYQQLQYDKFDPISLLLLEMTAGATVGIVFVNSASGIVLASRKLCQPQKEKIENIVQVPPLNLKNLAPPPSPRNLSDRQKRATVRVVQRQLHVQLGITLVTAAHAFDYRKARDILYEAAKLGDGLALCYLGILYECGLVIPPSLHAASFFYNDANGNHVFIKLVKSVGYLRRLIIGVVSCYEDAAVLLREAVELSLQDEFQHWQDTLEFLDRMAQIEGNVGANLILALVYELGLGVMRDLAKADGYYKRVATDGESWTHYNLGMLYQQRYKYCSEGNDAKTYYAEKAYYWLNASVQSRHEVREPLYWYNLGVLYREGLGIAQDYSQAKRCFEEARKLGCAAACAALGTMYEEGRGCERNLNEANRYRLESDSHSHNRRSAIVNLLSIEEELPSVNLKRKSKEIEWHSKDGYKKLVPVKVMCDYCDSERLDRLPVCKGEILHVYLENKNWLYAINSQGLKGMVPRNVIAICSAKSKNKVQSRSYQNLSIGFIGRQEIIHKKELENRTYTRVSQGLWARENKAIVIKELKEHAPLEEVEDFRAEGLLMAELDHPNIVKLLAFIQVSSPDSSAEDLPPKLVIEYMSQGVLSQYFSRKEQQLSEITLLLNEQRHEVALCIAKALCYLHEKGILHLDVKSMNVLLMLFAIECQNTLLQQLCAKLADFGTARQCGSELKFVDSKRIGTEDWLSPELRNNTNIHYLYTAASDVYAYGVFLWELFTYLDASLVKEYLLDRLQPIELEIPPDIDALIRSCCTDNPEGRPIMSNIVSRLSKQPQNFTKRIPIASSDEENIAKSRHYEGSYNGSPSGGGRHSPSFFQPAMSTVLSEMPLQLRQSESAQPEAEKAQQTVYRRRSSSS